MQIKCNHGSMQLRLQLDPLFVARCGMLHDKLINDKGLLSQKTTNAEIAPSSVAVLRN